MPPKPEPKRPDNDDTIGLTLGAIIGFVLFTLLGRLIRRPILLTVVVVSLFGLYQYSQFLLQQDLQHVTIQTVGSGNDCGDVRSIPVRITNADTRNITSFRFIATGTQPNQSLPITNTGYRSHFMPPAELDQWETVEGYVREWLDDAATAKCSIPDDYIDPRRSAFFMARSILRECGGAENSPGDCFPAKRSRVRVC